MRVHIDLAQAIIVEFFEFADKKRDRRRGHARCLRKVNPFPAMIFNRTISEYLVPAIQYNIMVYKLIFKRPIIDKL